jgi:hypothetical protein
MSESTVTGLRPGTYLTPSSLEFEGKAFPWFEKRESALDTRLEEETEGEPGCPKKEEAGFSALLKEAEE